MTEPAPSRRNVAIGIFWMLMTTFLFLGVTGVVRYLGPGIPAAEAAFIRYAVGLVLVSPALIAVVRKPPSRKTLGLFAARGLFHGFGVILWFFAMARIPIAEVTAIGYLAPILITIGAAIFFGERLHLRRIGAVLAAFVGAFIILRPGFQELSIGQLAQVASVPLFAASYLLTKRLTDDADPAAIVAMLSLFCTVTLLPVALMQWRQPTWEEVGFLSIVAVLATAGHYTMTLAIRAAPLTVTQPVGFLQLVWAALLGMIAFGEPLDPYIFVGGGIVVAAATFISHREAVVARKATTPPAAATKL